MGYCMVNQSLRLSRPPFVRWNHSQQESCSVCSCIVGKLDGMGCAARMLESCPDAYPPGRKVDSDTCSSSLFDSRLMTGSATGSATNSLQTICDTPESFDKSQGNSGLLTSGDSRVEVSTRPGNEV